MGNRLPQEMRANFRNMLEAGVTVPSLSHYVTYALLMRLGSPLMLVQLSRFMESWRLSLFL